VEGDVVVAGDVVEVRRKETKNGCQSPNLVVSLRT